MNTDNRVLFFGALAVLGVVLAGSQFGLLSFGSGIDYQIEIDGCEVTGQDSFTCPVENRPFGTYADTVKSALYGDAKDPGLNSIPVRTFLKDKGVLSVPRDGDAEDGRFAGENWQGVCTVTAGFEEDDSIIEVEVDGRLTSDARLGCETDGASVSSVEVTECNPPEILDGRGRLESCRAFLDGDAFGEYHSVEYTLYDDSDGDGVFDRNDDCPGEAGELENGCANTPPTVSVDAPATVEDEVEFAVSASASDPDGQDLSYSWSNGETGRSATYLYARSGVERELSVTVSDGLDSVSESATVEVVDGSTPPEEGSDGTDGDSDQSGVVSVLLELLALIPLVSLG